MPLGRRALYNISDQNHNTPSGTFLRSHPPKRNTAGMLLPAYLPDCKITRPVLQFPCRYMFRKLCKLCVKDCTLRISGISSYPADQASIRLNVFYRVLPSILFSSVLPCYLHLPLRRPTSRSGRLFINCAISIMFSGPQASDPSHASRTYTVPR